MLIFGEKINTINKKVDLALQKKDSEFFKNLTSSQLDSGIVDVIDINVGSDAAIEPDNMRWAAGIVEEVTSGKVPLSIDSSSPKTIIAGIEKLKSKDNSYINSITLEESRHKELLPVAKDYNLNIIALPMDRDGIPKSADGRLKLAYGLAELVKDSNISLEKLFIDCIIEPVSIGDDSALIALETVSKIKANIPGVKTIICLSAVSFGLPDRKLINRNFLSLLIREGIDSVILDPLDTGVVSSLYSANLLTGKDISCVDYIKYIKKYKVIYLEEYEK